MLFALDRSGDESLNLLFDVNDDNLDVLTMLRDYLVNHETYIKEEMIDKQRVKESFLYSLEDLYKIDKESILHNYLSDGVKQLDPSIIRDNPYYKNIKFTNVKEDNWVLKNDSYQPYQGFVFNSHKVNCDEYFKEIPQIGFFDEEVEFPAVFQDEVLWMSVTPNEINTMEIPIKKAKGNIITFGLGLGYFAYRVSNKSEVRSVTIIERDNKVINLFKKHILPKFVNKEKITIIQEDAFTYVNNNDMHQFDYIFIDLHHDASDGLDIYLKSVSTLKDINFDFWILDSIILLVRKMLINIIYDEYYSENNNYEYQTIYDELIKSLKDYVFTSYEQIKELLSDESIKSLLHKISFK